MSGLGMSYLGHRRAWALGPRCPVCGLASCDDRILGYVSCLLLCFETLFSFPLASFFLLTKVTFAHSNFFLADLRRKGIADGEACWGGEVEGSTWLGSSQPSLRGEGAEST